MRRIKLAVLLIALGLSMAARAQPAKLEVENFTIPSTDTGISLYMRYKHRAGALATTGDKVLLFVHGATYPSETTFDLPIEGVSMMDLFASHGYDVYLVDVRGYGGSTRPPEMSEPSTANKPLVHTADAARDLGAAVDHILNKHRVSKIDVMGWSWGTSIAGLYTSEHNDKVNRLVLYAPMWLFNSDTAVAPAPQASAVVGLGAYRLVSKESARDRWLKGVAPDKRDGLIPPGVFERWAEETWATDPDSAKRNMLRAPNGVIEDVMTNWMVGRPMYEPGKIVVPTFLIHAEWDADLPSYQAHGVFAQLKNAPYKRFVELSEGTHTVMLEKNRMQFFREVIGFLDEKDPQAIK
jgi:pimeloyl-ACP methyl ester carboxylesterase